MAWLLFDIDKPLYRGLVIRRNADDLTDWISRAKIMYAGEKAVFAGNPPIIRFPLGATIKTGHLKDEDAYGKYLGHEYQKILIEELTQITTLESYLKLISSCRSTVDGIKAQIFATTNPGSAGHKWVRSRFVDVAEPGKPFKDPKTGRTRIFIPAKVDDNPHLMKADPDYIHFLDGLSDGLRQAWREGSWDDIEIEGAYYAKQMLQAKKEGRITVVPHDPAKKVSTAWDIGVGDSTAIWFFQEHGHSIRLIDYYETTGEGLPYYVRYLSDKPYLYKDHIAPHDMAVRDFSTGKSRLETAQSLGIHFTVIPKLPVEEGIDAVRLMFNKCWFDKEKCEQGLDALTQYHKEFDEKRNEYKNRPYHDWTSHGCLVGDTIITTSKGDKQIKDVKVGEYVVTPMGNAKVTHAGAVKKTNKLIKIEFNNGRSITVTPEHKLFTGRGLVLADALRYNDNIINCHYKTCKTSLLHSRAENIGFREAIIEQKIGEKEHVIYTEQSGKTFMDRYQTGSIFTTLMKILSTIGLRIWNVLAGQTTRYSTQRQASGLEVKKTKNNCEKQESCQKYGIVVKKEDCGTKNTENNAGKTESGLLKNARNVAENTKLHIQQGQSIVTKIVGLQQEKEDLEEQLVYDLTVEKHHCYLANGILVSNSDAFRYLALGRKEESLMHYDIQDPELEEFRMIREFEAKDKYDPLSPLGM